MNLQFVRIAYAALGLVLAVSSAVHAEDGVPDAARIAQMKARFAPVDVRVDLSALPRAQGGHQYGIGCGFGLVAAGRRQGTPLLLVESGVSPRAFGTEISVEHERSPCAGSLLARWKTVNIA